MKYIFLLLITFISSVALGQTCGPEDTVTANVVSLVTSTTARINGTVSQIIADSADGLALRYVRVGQVDTVNSSSGPSSALRNLTGLSPSTQYVYYYKTTCPIGTATQSVAYYFTTLSATVGYVPERPTVFNYLKIDTALTIPQGDTTTARAATTLPQIKYKTSNNTFYGYYPDCICWRPLAIDSSGIIALLDDKVDSVTVSGDSLFYWKVGISYGYILPEAGWGILGNSGLDTSVNWIGTNDAVATKIRANGLDGMIVGISGGIRMPYLATSGTYYKTVRATSDGTLFLGDTLGTTPLSSLTAATAGNTINNTTFAQDWGWNSLVTGTAFKLSSTSTASSGGPILAEISMSGANANSNQLTTALSISNTHTGTTSTNYGVRATASGAATTNFAGWFSASGGTANEAVYVSDGTVTLIPLTASLPLKLNSSKNIISQAIDLSSATEVSNKLPINKIGAATGSNTIDNGDNLQVWNWNSFTAGNAGLALGSSSTAYTASGSTLLQVTKTGNNATSALTTYSASFGNTGAGTTSTNVAATFNAYNGTTANYAAQFQRGKVSFGTVATESGIIEVNGATSGVVTIKPQAAAGTYNFNLPTSAGTSGQPLLSGGGGGTAMTFGTLGLGGGGTGSTDGSGLPYWKLAGTNTLTADVNNTGFNVGFDVAAPKAQVHTTSFAAGYLKVTTDNYVILATDYTLSVDNEGNNWTILLPDATTCLGRIYIIKRFDDASTGTVTIDADGCNVQSPTAGTFAATQGLASWANYNQSVMFQSNGTDWEAIK